MPPDTSRKLMPARWHKHSGALLLLLCMAAAAHAGQLSKRLLISDTKDSLLFRAGMAFDEAGNYCFTVQDDSTRYFLTNTGKIIVHSYISTTFGGDASISETYNEHHPDTPWYYANYKGARIYGPVTGSLVQSADRGTAANMAIVVSRNDSTFTYINGVLKLAAPGATRKYGTREAADCFAFSPHGNQLYALAAGDGYSLYLNDSLLHHTTGEYSGLEVNDRGDYLFAVQEKQPKGAPHPYLAYIHTRDTVMGPVINGFGAKHVLYENGAWYCSGADTAAAYVATNNCLYRGVYEPGAVQVPDRKHSLFIGYDGGGQMLFADGKKYPLNYKTIYHATIDTAGSFACYGLRDYYLYPFVNGRELPPLSKYGVRATPIAISPGGSSFHLFRTDDSTYFYHDDTPFLPPVANTRPAELASASRFFGNEFVDDDARLPRPLIYLEVDSTGYFIGGYELTGPGLRAFGSRYQSFRSPQDAGEVLAGGLSGNSFYYIQKTGPQAYDLHINNRQYSFSGPDKLIPDAAYPGAGQLVFYGTEGPSFYQYTLKL